MKILVTYASRHRATTGIAERIARTLERTGLDVTLPPVKDVGPIEPAPVGTAEGLMARFVRLVPATRNALPAGDFRDWPASGSNGSSVPYPGQTQGEPLRHQRDGHGPS